MSNVSTTTTLGDFFASIATQIKTALGYSSNRVFVVDRMRLQESAIPNIQIEPVSLTPLADNVGLNACQIEYRVHAVVKVEYDFAKRFTEALVDNKSAFLTANSVAEALRGFIPGTGSSSQVFMKLDSGAHDDATGLASASVTMRSFIRILADG